MSNIQDSSPSSAVKIIGIIGAVVLLLGCIVALGYGTYKFITNEADISNKESSADDGQKGVIVRDNQEGVTEQKRKTGVSSTGSTLDEAATQDTVKDEVKDDPKDDIIEDTSVGEFLVNNDFEFKFKVADASKYSVIEEWSEVAGKQYSILSHCYELDDTSFDEDFACGTGKAGIFFISVFDSAGWTEYQKGPFGSGATLLGENNNQYYALESTEDFIPTELKTEIDSILETVRDSFEITAVLDEI